VLVKPNNVIGTGDQGHGNVLLSDTRSTASKAFSSSWRRLGKPT
jgi:hypothetical protein